MKPKSNLRSFLLAAGSSLLAISSAHAAIRNWDGDTSVTWATAGNWDTAPANSLATDIANFNLATYGGNPVYAPNAGTTSINGITIGASNGAMTLTTTNLSIGGSGITIANGAGALNVSGAVTIGAAQTWTNNDNDTASFGVINHNATATNKLTLAGSGKFLFNGVNTGKGGININSGTTLEIGSAGKLYGTYENTSVVTVASGATLKANGWGWDTAGGLGQLFNSRTALVVNGGTIEYAGNSNSTGNATSQQNFTVGTGGATLKATTAGQTWTLTLGDAQEFYNNLINDTGLTVGGAGNGVIQKHIIGTNTNGSLTKIDGGTWTLTGANTYKGVTTLTGGILSVGSIGNGGVASGNLGSATSAATNIVFNGGTLKYTGANSTSDRAFTINAGKTATIETANNISFAGATGAATTGALTKTGNGKLTLTGVSTYTGTTTISAGTLALGTSGSIASSPTVIVGASTTFDVSAVTGGYTLGGTQTLSGSGTVTGAMTVSGTLSPGNSPGILPTGSQTWVDGGAYNFQMLDATGSAGTGFDQIQVTGTLNLTSLTTGGFNINLWSLSSTGPDMNGNALNFNNAIDQSWIILTTSGGISGFQATDFLVNVGANNGTGGFSNALGGGSFSIGATTNNLILNFDAVPEPGAALIGSLGLLALLRRRRS